MAYNDMEAYQRLAEVVLPALHLAAGPMLAEKGCLALAVSAIKSQRELDVLLYGTQRSVAEGNISDLCFRILEKEREAVCEKARGAYRDFIERSFSVLRGEWMANRLKTYVMVGRIEDFPDFFRADLAAERIR